MQRGKGTIDVFTFKEGLLSAAAHDLQIRLEQFDISLEGGAVLGEFQLRSLRLVGPVEDGVVQPSKYDAGKRADVEKAMNEDVLATEKNPLARFSGTAAPRGEGYGVTGNLELNGKTAPLAFEVTKEGSEYKGVFEFQPSRWGVKQYKAMLGSIRLKDLIRVKFALTAA